MREIQNWRLPVVVKFKREWAEIIVDIARTHVGHGTMVSSAESALEDAVKCLHRESNYVYPASRALQLLQYSLGMFHPMCVEVKQCIKYNLPFELSR